MKYALMAATAAAAAILFAAPAAADADGAPTKNDRGTAHVKPRAQRPPVQHHADFDLGKVIFNIAYPPRPPKPAPVMPELPANAPIWAKELRVAINDFVYYHPAPNQPWLPR